MKKTLIASAILLAGAANAAEVYNNEGTTVELGGSFRGHVAISDSDKPGTKDAVFEDAGSRFDIKAKKVLSETLTAYGRAEIKNTGDDKGLYLNKSYVALAHTTFGAVELGKQYGLNDDIVFNDFSYEAGVYNEDNDKFGSDSIDQLKYTKGFGGAKIVVSLMDQDTYAIGGTYDIAGLTIAGSYNIANDRQLAGAGQAFDNSTYIVAARYKFDALTLGAQYQAGEAWGVEQSAAGIGAHFALGQAGFYAMYDMIDGDFDNLKGSEIVVGADYALADGVVTYAEFTASERDLETADNYDENKLVLGARVYF